MTKVLFLLLALSLSACSTAPASSEPVEGVRVVRAQVRGIT
jgi:starvation-inducible outer membrane lipoprotein